MSHEDVMLGSRWRQSGMARVVVVERIVNTHADGVRRTLVTYRGETPFYNALFHTNVRTRARTVSLADFTRRFERLA